MIPGTEILTAYVRAKRRLRSSCTPASLIRVLTVRVKNPEHVHAASEYYVQNARMHKVTYYENMFCLKYFVDKEFLIVL